ncbi:MAG: lysophospholipase [Alphaproteobacteria bacterium]|nr:lysophospholipase [Alphaproteobacteria bacterium]|tara:strand:- start:631 stop:1071 length:441 start_codon:yes stop_codon:yes gene_type:complete
MSVHLVKLAVSIESIDHLRERQKQRIAERKAAGDGPVLRILTRNTPRRGDEILENGGSLYWVIRGRILVRQRITAIEPATGKDGTPRCAIHLDRKLVRVQSKRSRPFQGWRYLEPENAPADLPSGAKAEREPPPEMAAELRELGLI